MSHPREEYGFTDIYEVVADQPDRRDVHIEFLATQELAEKFMADMVADWGPNVIWSNPGIRKLPVINRLPE